MSATDPVSCDGCKVVGRRPLTHPAPVGWFFIAATDDSGDLGQTFYVYACSEGCRDKMWQHGPGLPLPGVPAAIERAIETRAPVTWTPPWARATTCAQDTGAGTCKDKNCPVHGHT